METVVETTREVPVVASADVVVAGGGPAGFAAAVAAARQGARVILVEQAGYAGGLATAGLVNPLLGHTVSNGEEPIVEGILKETVERMHDLGGAVGWKESLSAWGVNFEAEAYKYVADTMLEEAGVDVRFRTTAAAVTLDDAGTNQPKRLDTLITESKSGREALRGRVFVDATGDADLAAWSGLEYTQGRPFDGAVQSMGSFIHFGGMSQADDGQIEAAKTALEREMTAGTYRFYNPHFSNPGPRRSVYFAPNITRFSGDPTNAEDLSRGEQSVRRDAWRLLEFLKRQPGLEDAFILRTSATLGPRESRQIVGRYRLTGADVHEGRRFDDAIARGSWWIDIHCPLGYTFPVHLCVKQCPKGDECPYWRAEHDGEMYDREDLYAPDGGWYDIPYRTLTAVSHANLLVAGRSISADHQGMAGARVMGTCMAIGEAAGVAAAMTASDSTTDDVSSIDVGNLRRDLTDAGALV